MAFFIGRNMALLINTTTNMSDKVMKYSSDDYLCDYKQNNFIIDLLSPGRADWSTANT